MISTQNEEQLNEMKNNKTNGTAGRMTKVEKKA